MTTSVIINSLDHYSVETSHTVLSDRLKLEIPQTNESDRGQYSCRVGSTNGKFVYKNITLRITGKLSNSLIAIFIQHLF